MVVGGMQYFIHTPASFLFLTIIAAIIAGAVVLVGRADQNRSIHSLAE
jgi:hypothetical protein